MKIKKRILSLALAGTMALGLMPGMSMTALAVDGDTSYTLTIPSTLNVSGSGWNATDGISATGTLASGKKLTVIASSANSWALKSGSNSVGYNLAKATGTYSSSATPASWEFTAAELNASGGTNKAMGIIVEDYSEKPAGTYLDTVTFTAKVESAVSAPLADLRTNGTKFEFNGDNGYGAPIKLTFTVSNGQPADVQLLWNGEQDDSNRFTISLANDSITFANKFTTFFNAGLSGNTYTSVSRDSVTVKINDKDITSQLTKQ